MESSTKILRRLLDERGVEHYDGTERTLWLKDGVGYRASADEGLNGFMQLHLWCTTPEQAIAATLGNRTDLYKRLREVYGLHAFAELFGFDWTDGSDWDWHDVACAMADAVDAATVDAVPETKYLMALDKAREAQRKLEMCQTSQRAYQSKCRSLKETNADLRRIIGEMRAATLGATDAKPTQEESSGTCHITDNGPWGYPYVCSACGVSFDPDVNNGEFNYCPNCGRRVEQ